MSPSCCFIELNKQSTYRCPSEHDRESLWERFFEESRSSLNSFTDAFALEDSRITMFQMWACSSIMLEPRSNIFRLSKVNNNNFFWIKPSGAGGKPSYSKLIYTRTRTAAWKVVGSVSFCSILPQRVVLPIRGSNEYLNRQKGSSLDEYHKSSDAIKYP